MERKAHLMMTTPPSDTKMPELSVIITFYREFAFVNDAIHSILGQGLPNFEIILVNDNPDPDVQDFLNRNIAGESIRIVHHATNLGLATARNSGLKASSGRYVTFLDADDYFLPGGLRGQLALALQSKADLAHAPFLAGSEGIGAANSVLTTNQIDVACFEFHSTSKSLAQVPQLQLIVAPWKFLHKRSFMIKNGLEFDPEFRKFEDRPFVLTNILSHAKFAFYASPSRVWRKHANSSSSVGKTDIDLVNMSRSIERCIEIIAEKSCNHTNGADLMLREIVHSLARAIGNTPLFASAIGEQSCSATVRKMLVKFTGSVPPSPALSRDPVVRRILADLKRRYGHIGFTDAVFFDLWRDISHERWADLRKSSMVQKLVSEQHFQINR